MAFTGACIGRGNGFGSLNPPKLAGIGAVGSRGCRTSRPLITRDQFQSYSCTARRRACNCFDRDFPTI